MQLTPRFFTRGTTRRLAFLHLGLLLVLQQLLDHFLDLTLQIFPATITLWHRDFALSREIQLRLGAVKPVCV